MSLGHDGHAVSQIFSLSLLSLSNSLSLFKHKTHIQHTHTHAHTHQMRYRETQKLQKQRDAESEKTEKSLDESGVKKLKGDSSNYLMSVDFCMLLGYQYSCDRIASFSMLCLFSERLQLIDTTLLKCYIKVCL